MRKQRGITNCLSGIKNNAVGQHSELSLPVDRLCRLVKIDYDFEKVNVSFLKNKYSGKPRILFKSMEMKKQVMTIKANNRANYHSKQIYNFLKIVE